MWKSAPFKLEYCMTKLQGGVVIHIIGRFLESGEVGGLIDTLKNSGIQRRDMIISNYDAEKFETMNADTNPSRPIIMSDQDDPGELKAFVEGAKELDEDNGIIVLVKAARHKAQEVKSVMEQAGALEIVVDD